MAALTQDYKAQRRSTPDSRRLRDFGYGAACGALLSGLVVAWLVARSHPAPAPAPVATQHAPAATRNEPGATAAEPLTYPIILARITVPAYPTTHDARTPPASAHRAPTR